tara:strand:- start:350 stop:535 length:186 start_codon:yes stop_codon:yes gene_type:complete
VHAQAAAVKLTVRLLFAKMGKVFAQMPALMVTRTRSLVTTRLVPVAAPVEVSRPALMGWPA